MNRPVFQRLVQQSIAELPEQFRAHLNNLEIVVRIGPTPKRCDWPAPPTRLASRLITALLTVRTTNYGQVMPDRISIYRRPILLVCANRAEVRGNRGPRPQARRSSLRHQ